LHSLTLPSSHSSHNCDVADVIPKVRAGMCSSIASSGAPTAGRSWPEQPNQLHARKTPDQIPKQPCAGAPGAQLDGVPRLVHGVAWPAAVVVPVVAHHGQRLLHERRPGHRAVKDDVLLLVHCAAAARRVGARPRTRGRPVAGLATTRGCLQPHWPAAVHLLGRQPSEQDQDCALEAARLPKL